MMVEREDEQMDEAPRVSSLAGEGQDGEGQAVGARAGRAWRWGLRLGALVAVVALLGVVGAVLAPLLPRLPTYTPPLPNILALNLSPNLSDCASTGYWSPDGRSIAVLRSATACGMTTRQPDVSDVYLYDTRTGQQTAAYSTTAAIQDALVSEGASDWTIAYDSLSWAPSLRTLAVLWHADPSPFDAANSLTQVGLALVTLGGAKPGAVSIMLGEGGPGPTPPGGLEPFPPIPGLLVARQWDVGQGGHGAFQVRPAQAYAWAPDDSLVELTSFQGAQIQPMPREGQAFSAWRTGVLSVANTAQCQSQGVAGPPVPFALLTLDINGWSPDSRYLLDLTIQTRVPGAPGVAYVYNAGACIPTSDAGALPIAPLHDKALRAAIGLLGAGGAEQATLLWSADGKRLVAIPSSAKNPPTIALVYSTATGALLTRIAAGGSQIPSAQGSDASATITGAAWSSDGKRLLVAINGLRFTIRVYSGRALG